MLKRRSDKMLTKIEGIIVKETLYGETSKIINILTKDYGIIGLMCKGAKSPKSPLRALTLKFTYGFFYVYYKENKLSLLKDVDVIEDFSHIKSDITLISYMSYLNDLTYQVYKQSNKPSIYDLFIKTLKKIENGMNPLILTNILELKYLPYLGVGLELDSCIICGSKNHILTIDADVGGFVCKNCYQNQILVNPKTIKLIRMYYYVDIDSIIKISIQEEIAREINLFINRYYDRYTGLYLNSKKFLNELLNVNVN